MGLGAPKATEKNFNRPRGKTSLPALTMATLGALSAGVAKEANAQAAYELPNLDVEYGDINIQRLQAPGRAQVTYATAQVVNKIDFKVASQGGDVTLSQIAYPSQVDTQATSLLYLENGRGGMDTLEHGVVIQPPFTSAATFNGVDKWSELLGNCSGTFQDIFPSGNHAFGINSGIQSFLFPVNPDSDNWCADFDAAGGASFTNPIIGTRGNDRTQLVGDTFIIKMIDEGGAQNVPVGPRVILQNPQGNPIQIDMATGRPEASQSFVGQPDFQLPNGSTIDNFYAANEVAGHPGLALVYGQFNGQNGFIALQAEPNGTVSMPNVIIRTDIQGAIDDDLDGIPNESDVLPNMKVPGAVDSNANGVPDAGDVTCATDAPVGADGLTECESNDLGYAQALRRAADGSRILADAGVEIALANGVLTLDGIPQDGSEVAARWIHAQEALGANTPSPNIQLPELPQGFGYNVRVKANSLEGMDGQNHPIRVLNAADIINGGAPTINAAGESTVEFNGNTGALFGLEGTDVEFFVSVHEREVPVDAALPVDAGAPVDAALPEDAGVPDDAATPPLDAAVPEDAATPPEDAGVPVDAALPVDASVPEDAAVPPVDASLPEDAATPPVDASEPECIPTEEECDGVDNDCDEHIDEDTNVIVDGECGAVNFACVNGQLVPQDQIRTPDIETCNGLDDDCDGQIDEGLSETRSNECGNYDAVCVNGQMQEQNMREPEVEVCDGVDNDCDGRVDNGPNGEMPMILNEQEDPCNPGRMIQQLCIGGTPRPENMIINCGDTGVDAEVPTDAGVPPDTGMEPIPDEGAPVEKDMGTGGTGGEGGHGGDIGEGGTGGEGGKIVTPPTKPEEKGKSGGGCTVAPGQNTSDALPTILGAAALALAATRRRKTAQAK